jgi:hypothetical protein
MAYHPLSRTTGYSRSALPNSSGRRAMLMAIRCASSFVSIFVAGLTN